MALPIPRFEIEEQFQIDEYVFFPKGVFDVERHNPIHPRQLVSLCEQQSEIPGTGLRWTPVTLTKFSADVLTHHTLVVFDFELDWDVFMSHRHVDDVELIQILSGHAEKAMNFIRFKCCDFELPDSLPGEVGTWFSSEDYMGAMIFNPGLDKSFLLAGSGVECSSVVKGIGLLVDQHLAGQLPSSTDGEVGGVAAHALELFTDVLTSPTSTIKYVRAMTLLEFLANPWSYESWKKSKHDIACHVAKSQEELTDIAERFKELTSIVDASGVQQGLRTLIVHHGKLLPELIPENQDRKKLFSELQRYASMVMKDMLRNTQMSWSQFSEFRQQKKQHLRGK